MGQSLECMHVLYIISEFQFQHFPIPPNPSPIISLMAVIKAEVKVHKEVWASFPGLLHFHLPFQSSVPMYYCECKWKEKTGEAWERG